VRGGLVAALVCMAPLGATPPAALAAGAHSTGARRAPLRSASSPSTSPSPSTSRSALVVFLSPGEPLGGRSESDVIERELDSIPTLSTGILSATQGSYTTAQMALDITQGARVSGSAYKPSNPPFLRLPLPGEQANGSQVEPWSAVLARAHSAPQLLDPGLLATQIPGGGAYVPASGVDTVDGTLAADRSGHVAAVLASSGTLLGSVEVLRAHHRLIVADLPLGPAGLADLRALAASRPAGELLVAIQRSFDEPNNASGQAGNELLWIAFAGLPPLRGTGGPGGRALTSQTTNQSGLIAAIDVAPTILQHLGLPIPADMRGKTVRLDGHFDGQAIRALKARLGVITARRLPAIAWLVAAWALLLAAARLPLKAVGRPPLNAAGRLPLDAAGRRARAAWAMRVGALAMLWAPVAVLIPAALEPSRTVEFALIVATCFALAALTDRLMGWPRAPIVPAVAAVLALSVDALAGTQLLMRSLLGPDPILGARFYGIGNELKSGLAVLVFAAVAAALYPAVRSRRAASTMACAGIVLAVVEGSARIGAGVGGVILVSAGAAVATVMLLPGTLNRKRVLIVMAAPVAGLVALAALDLATAHGGGHFTGSVLDARSAGDIRDIIVRRYGAAWGELKNHLMPVATALAVIASVVAVRRRERVCEPVDSDPAWLAALAGGLTAGVIGALTEDSGPVLLVVAVFALGCVLSYLWGQPLGDQSVGAGVSSSWRVDRRPR
jgi:hypothetical protein